ncbi:hypothetical protein [Thermoflexus sp.]|uniref:hypothetical protein n=1 Tax=Thermoflexus sp. TaxID=1969742 RepID=UPI0035E424F1
MNTLEQPAVDASEAKVVHLSGVRLGSLIANEAICENAVVSHLAANQIHAQGSALGIGRSVQLELQRGAVGLAFPREAILRESQAGVVIARSAQMEGGRVGLVLAYSVEGRATGLSASWAGLLVGFVLGVLLGWHLRRSR